MPRENINPMETIVPTLIIGAIAVTAGFAVYENIDKGDSLDNETHPLDNIDSVDQDGNEEVFPQAPMEGFTDTNPVCDPIKGSVSETVQRMTGELWHEGLSGTPVEILDENGMSMGKKPVNRWEGVKVHPTYKACVERKYIFQETSMVPETGVKEIDNLPIATLAVLASIFEGAIPGSGKLIIGGVLFVDNGETGGVKRHLGGWKVSRPRDRGGDSLSGAEQQERKKQSQNLAKVNYRRMGCL